MTSTLQSMTGYGRAQGDTPFGQFTAEIRTVNNRFQDLSISLPRELSALEQAVRNTIRQNVLRGKMDVRIRWTAATNAPTASMRVNAAVARQYVEQIQSLQALGISGDLPLATLVTLPGVVELTPPDLEEDALWAAVLPVLQGALDQLNLERQREGQALATEMLAMGDQLREALLRVESLRDGMLLHYRQRLAARLEELTSELGVSLDAGRLEMEVALFADRSDIAEEIVRLRTHLERYQSLLTQAKEPTPGKSLDFLVQEMLRETNTIASKARDVQVTGETLAMKAILERIREQLQNLQ